MESIQFDPGAQSSQSIVGRSVEPYVRIRLQPGSSSSSSSSNMEPVDIREEESAIAGAMGRFSNDLWIERCSKLKEVLDQLEQLRSKTSPSSLIGERIQFIRFLDDYCSGKHFNSDKQWGELLNLMKISRKLNHKSAKFRHIIANKQQIESNAGPIRAHQAAARLGQAIELALAELESLVQSSRLLVALPASSQHSATADTREADFRLKQLMETNGHLRDKCQAQLNSLRLTLDDAKLSRDTRLESWQMRTDKLGQSLGKMSTLVRDLMTLQAKLAKINYLVAADSRVASQNSGGGGGGTSISKVRQSIDECKLELIGVQLFHASIWKLFVELARRSPQPASSYKSSSSLSEAAALPLIKLFEPKSQLKSGEEIRAAIGKLDECQRKLDQVMQQLRREFGRFYFLNDVELLSIVMTDTDLIIDSNLAQNKRLISKLFNESIGGFIMATSRDRLIGVQSPCNEAILFTDEQFVAIRKPVQVYSLEVVRILNEVQRKLRQTLKSLLLASFRNDSQLAATSATSATGAIDWSLPMQLIHLVECIKFCSKVEQTLANRKPGQPDGSNESPAYDQLVQFYEQQSSQLSVELNKIGWPGFDQNSDNCCSSSNKMAAIISLNVHFISLLMRLKEQKVSRANDWLWQKQVRYYLTSDGDLEVRIADTKFGYKFDYLPPESSSRGRLISTKITERCFLLASQAVGHLRLGANPHGPAGGGKTETIKALARLLGCQVIVYNCDESNDTESLERLVWGLAHTGLWGCFDEFNRLSASTLSAISASLELIQTSIREGRHTVELPDGAGMACIDQQSAFFVTLNPAAGATTGQQSSTSNGGGGGNSCYGGRRRLPANIRTLFLPVSMARVQIDSIVRENLLALMIELSATLERPSAAATSMELLSTATKEASWMLGRKLDQFLESIGSAGVAQMGPAASGQQLQQQFAGNRCAWDLRLVMAVLRRLKRTATLSSRRMTSNGLEPAQPSLSKLMVEALSDEVEPRLSNEEFLIFTRILGESFDLSPAPRPRERTRTEEDSVALLEAQLETRAGVILLGRPKSGKSSIWRQLMKQRSGTNERQCYWAAINAKSCSGQSQLFGFADETPNRKWHDGLLTAKVREALTWLQQQQQQQQQQQHHHKQEKEQTSSKEAFIILDGPIDPDWIESLNSVLDDNRVLTLSSGERLTFSLPSGHSIKLLFETDSIEFASPATISRLGLVYLEPTRGGAGGDSESPPPPSPLVVKLSNLSEPLESIPAPIQDRLQLEANQLIIISTGWALDSAADYQLVTRFCLQTFGQSSSNQLSASVIEYSCNQLSNSDDLIDLLGSNGKTNQVYLIHNIELIQAQDQWGARSFIELILFILDHGGYYDVQDESYPFVSTKGIKFIITICKDHHHQTLVNRLESKSSLLIKVLARAECEIEALNQTDELVERRQRSFVSIVQNDIRQPISFADAADAADAGKNRFDFCSSNRAAESIDCLKRLLLQLVQKEGLACSKDETSSENSVQVYHLNQLEFGLLEVQTRATLIHVLNRLQLSRWARGDESDAGGKCIKFIYNCYELPKELLPLARGNIVTNQANEMTSPKKQQVESIVCDCLLKSGGSGGGGLSREQIAWIGSKVSETRCKPFVSGDDSELEKLPLLAGAIVWLFQRASSNLTLRMRALMGGLQELAHFDARCEQMRSHCKSQELKVGEKNDQIRLAARSIDESLKASKLKRNEVDTLRQRLEAKRLEVVAKRDQLELKLAQVLPLIEASKSEIKQQLKPEALNEIKTLRAPPQTIKDILEVLFLILGARADSWAAMKGHLARATLRDELTNFDFKQRLSSAEFLAEVEHSIELRRVSFSGQQAARASRAIVPILNWIQAGLEYGRVLIKSEPLRHETGRLEAELAALNEALASSELSLIELDTKMASEGENLARLEQEMEQLRQQLEQIHRQLAQSQQLLANLESQSARWRTDLHRIKRLLLLENESSNGGGGSNWKLMQLCSMVANLALYHEQQQRQQRLSEIRNFWLDLDRESGAAADCSKFELLDSLALVLGIDECLSIGGSQPAASADRADGADDDDDDDETRRIVQLIALRECIALTNCADIRSVAASSSCCPWTPIVDLSTMDSPERTSSQEELLNLLRHKGILNGGDAAAAAAAEIDFVRYFELDGCRFQQAIEMALKWNRLVALDIREQEHSVGGLARLDLAHFLLQKPANLRLLLVGNLEQPFEQHFARYLIPFRLLATGEGCSNFSSSSSSDLNELQANILQAVLEFEEPKLMQSLDLKRKELQQKQSEMKTQELNLLEQLSSQQSGGHQSGEPLEELMGVVGILSELQQLSVDLADHSRMLETQLGALKVKQQQYFEYSLESAKFYAQLLLAADGGGGGSGGFSRLSVKKYTELLLRARLGCKAGGLKPVSSSSSRSSSSSILEQRQFIVRRAMQPMDPAQRREFVCKLRSTSSSSSWSPPSEDDTFEAAPLSRLAAAVETGFPGWLATRLGRAILVDAILEPDDERLTAAAARWSEAKNNNNNSKSGARCKLIVILHDPSKSSPQFELDYLFGRALQQAAGAATPARELAPSGGRLLADASAKATATAASKEKEEEEISFALCEYQKVYATGGSNQSRLDSSLGKFLAAAVAMKGAPDGDAKWRRLRRTRCLCVVNAHLAAAWLNANLRNHLAYDDDDDAPHDCSATAAAAASDNLVILIGESSQPSRAWLDSRVLERAQLCYWHDEMALDPIGRYEMFLGAFKWAPPHAGANCQAQQQLQRQRELDLLCKQLILMHVVCQERAKLGLWSRATANIFDYDQLSLAFKCLHRLASDGGGGGIDSLRRALSDHLEDIVYGSRMETSDDELQLAGLIGRFLRRTGGGGTGDGSPPTIDHDEQPLARLERLRRLRATGGGPAPVADESRRLLAELVGGGGGNGSGAGCN